MRALVGVRRAWPAPLAMAVSCLLLSGCTSESPAPRAPHSPVVPLEKIDLSGVAAVRAPFCDALDHTAVLTVLGGTPLHQASYNPGDRVRLTPALRDVAHEYGCALRRRGITARAWLFAQPVTRAQARSYLAARQKVPGCVTSGVLAFGKPGLTQLCRPVPHGSAAGAVPGTTLVTMSGLFGGGYLTCQVSATPKLRLSNDDLVTRTERWCASVATTVGTS